MDVGHLLSLLPLGVGLVFGAGGLLAYFQKGRGDSIIAYQGNEISLRDGTIARQKEDLAALTAERDTLKRQNADLVGLAQGSPQLIRLTQEIKGLAQEVAKIISQGAIHE